MISELGGITKVIMFIFGFFLYPISEHSFTLKALKKLYLAKSKDPLLMKSKKKKNLKTVDVKNDKTEAQKVVVVKKLKIILKSHKTSNRASSPTIFSLCTS